MFIPVYKSAFLSGLRPSQHANGQRESSCVRESWKEKLVAVIGTVTPTGHKNKKMTEGKSG